MAEVKWIKISTEIFDNRKIKQIESLPDGDSIIVIWVKLLCLAGQINDCGMIYFTKEIPYTEQMLAQHFNRPLTTIQMALNTFQQFGMIELIDNVVHISNWEKYQNVEGMERIREQNRLRKQRQREKQKLLPNVSRDCHVTVTKSHATDIEEDIDLDKEKISITVSKDTVRSTDILRIMEAWNELDKYGIPQVTKVANDTNRYKQLTARIKSYGVDSVLEAIGKIADSSYLQGGGKNGWMITFDWFIRPNNFPKVLEGNYDNSGTNSKPKNVNEIEPHETVWPGTEAVLARFRGN